MPIQTWVQVDTAIQDPPSAPPDTPRTYAIMSPTAPAGAVKAVPYSTLAEMDADGWGTSFPAYQAMARLLEQQPALAQVSAVVVIAPEPAIPNVWTFDTDLDFADGDHTLSINGVLAATFTASANTAEEVKDGLLAAFAVGPFASSHTGATVDTDTGSITGNVAGVPFVLTGSGPGVGPTIIETVASVGVYQDLDAGHALLKFWGVLMPGAVDAVLDEGRRWVHADRVTRRCVLLAENADPAVYDIGDTDNLGALWSVAGYDRAYLLSHPNATDYIFAGMVGRLGGSPPGSRRWHRVVVTGSTESTITANRTTAETLTMLARGVSYTERFDGPASDLEFINGTGPASIAIYQKHTEDDLWYRARVIIDDAMKSAAGVNLTEAGLQSLADAIAAGLVPMVNAGSLAPDISVSFVPLEDVPPGEIALGDYQSTGAVVVSATITPRLKKLRVSATLALS
jgi:hypothetical protein